MTFNFEVKVIEIFLDPDLERGLSWLKEIKAYNGLASRAYQSYHITTIMTIAYSK